MKRVAGLDLLRAFAIRATEIVVVVAALLSWPGLAPV